MIIPIYLTLIFVGYMVLTDRIAGTTYSISASFYAWKAKNYSSAFIIFLALISFGLFLVVDYVEWKTTLAPILLIIGAITNYAIGVYANYKQEKAYSTWHNILSALTFLLVHLAFFIEGVRFPMLSFILLAAVFFFIDIDKKTTVIETVGIGLAILGVYYLI